MKFPLFGRKPAQPEGVLPESDHGPASKALAAIFMATNMLVESGMTQADGEAYHDALGRGLARFHQTVDHTPLETNTLSTALEIYCSPIAAQAFAEEYGDLSGPAMIPVFEVYEIAGGRSALKPDCNPFFGPAAILWDAGMNEVPQSAQAVQLATQMLAERFIR